MKITRLDRFLLGLAPRYAINRIRARASADLFARHYEAAMPGRRTSGWNRSTGDADLNIRGAIAELRMHARDLVRNNAYARRAQRIIANNTVGWGIMPTPLCPENPAVALKAGDLWRAWAESKECDADGRHTFYGIQNLVMKGVSEGGEVLVRRRFRRPTDNLTIPLQLQVLESDYLDHAKNTLESQAGGPIIQGVEFDLLGKRAAYWLFPQHPGSGRNYEPSQRIPADQVIHVYYTERAAQTRGVSWFAPVILSLKDFDEYEDAVLMRQKIAACYAAFVTEADGPTPVGATTADPLVQEFAPGMIAELPIGKDIKFASPPLVTEDTWSVRNLHRIAAGLNVPYEEMTNDYSQVNFSSARMSRLSHWANVHDWRENMLIPLLCQDVWDWAMEAAILAEEIPEACDADWIAPPMPMIEPDKEGLAYQRLLRNGVLTHDQMVREQGSDPETHWAAFAARIKAFKAAGIVLDSDPSQTTVAGQEQPSETAAADPGQPSDAAREVQEAIEFVNAVIGGPVQ